MDFKKNRVVIGAAALVVLLGGTIYAIQRRDVPRSGDESALPELPEVDRDAVTRLEITIEVGETVAMEKRDGVFRVVAPVVADADLQAIQSALDKLADLEVAGVASTRSENHERLEVGDNQGVRVVAKAGDRTLIDVRIGGFRGGNTMVRLAGEDTVIAVRESIKYLFNKELKDWRDRKIVDVSPEDVRDVQITSANGTFHFARGENGEWAPAEGQAAIERFGAARVQSHVATFARMRAMGFAAPGTAVDTTGLATPAATVTLQVRERVEARDGGPPPAEAPTTTIVIELGGEATGAGELYARRQGKDVLYTISQFIADRMRPGTDAFQDPEPGEEPAAPPAMPMGPIGGPHGGGGQIPPEVMEALQRQMQQGGGHP